MVSRAAYRARQISFLGREQIHGWLMKVYGLSVEDREPREALVSAGLDAAAQALPPLTDPTPLDGYGFCIVHESERQCYVLVQWWAETNEVHQCLYSGPVSGSQPLAPHDSPAIGCVWELAVTDHERRAWLTHVLARPEDPDVGAYLASTLSGRV